MKAFLPNDIKDQNRKIIYDILQNTPPIAKVEIAEMTTMSLVTVGKIIDYFEEIGILTQLDENRVGARGLGRRRILYEFNPNKHTSIGVQIIGNKAFAVLLNLKNEIIESYSLEDEIFFGDNSLEIGLTKIKKQFEKTIKKLNSQVLGIGIAVDGAINNREEKIRLRVGDNEEKEFSYSSIIKSLENKLKLPVLLENDVNSSVLYEFCQLELQDNEPENLLEIALNDGVGAGIILNKKLYKGNKTGVGELQYMCFDLDYVKKPTSVGWLEKKLNIKELEKRFLINLSTDDKSSIKIKEECVEYISKYIALTICNTVSLLDISNIVISGTVVRLFSKEILGKVEEFVFGYTGWKLNIFISEFEHSSAVGAGLLSIENEISKILFS